jgi:hypothetical protein
MDPIALIVTSLASGAAAGLKPTAEQAVKDAYAGLKRLIQGKYSKVSLQQLEESPESKARRSVVEEDLAKMDAGKDEQLLRAAKQLLDVVQTHAPETTAAIGVDLEQIEGASLNIEDITAGATGVKVKGAEIAGEINIKKVRAGGKPDSPNS